MGSDTPAGRRRRSVGHAVNLASWKRRAHYELFRKYEQPFFSVTVDVEVTPVWNYCRKPGGPPFFLTSVFLVLKAANDTEAFRLRLRKRGVWLHDRVAVGSPILRSDETFGFVRLEPSSRLEQFVRTGKAAIAKAEGTGKLEPMKRPDDVVFHSALPWLRFRAFTNALPGDDSIPRIAFGRCTSVGRKVMMPVAVEVHHALVDGLDVGHFLERFEAGLTGFSQEA